MEERHYPGKFAASAPDRPAVVMAGSGTVVTFGELHRTACQFANLLRSLGLQPGDHVALGIENGPMFLPLMWGAHYAGLYYTAFSTRLSADEAAYVVDNCGAKVLVLSDYLAPLAADLLAGAPQVGHRFSLGGQLDGYESLEDALAAQPADEPDGLVEGEDMLYSSGTTGRPKGVKPPLRNVPLGTPGVIYLLVVGLFGANEDTVYLSPAPLYHAAPMRFSMNVQRAGGTVVVMEHFDAEESLRLIEEHHVTFGQFVPTMFVRMLKLPDEVRTRYDVSSMQVAVHAAAPCPVPVKRAMIDWWGPVLHEYYAGTEGNGFVYTNSEGWLAHPGSVGQAVSGVLHVLGDDGNELPAGESGTVYFESEAKFEYHNDPEKTAGSYSTQGWSTLGDVGYVDADGFLYLTDRKAYMIITGGVNVYPQEAENVLTMHPAVVDVAVFGIPDDEMGEKVHAVVQPAEMPADAAAAATLSAELTAYCREHLAHLKCPRSVDFREELPRHPTGKLYKRLLKDEYWAGSGRTI
jgi:acyl-CoA synthetase (AMP-forming)/AMP-acid ligase II